MATEPKITPGSELLSYPPRQQFLGVSLGTDSGPPKQHAVIYIADSEMTFFGVTACAVVRDPDGQVLGVSNEVAIDALDPGENRDVDFEFSASISGVWRIDVEARAHAAKLIRKDDSGSRTLDLDNFEVTLPAGWAYIPLQGIDSHVGEFNRDGVKVFFDYGWYSGNLDAYENDPLYAVSHETIDGREAVVVTPRGSRSGFTAASILVEDDATPNTFVKTTILLQADDVPNSLRAEVLSIYRSLRFESE